MMFKINTLLASKGVTLPTTEKEIRLREFLGYYTLNEFIAHSWDGNDNYWNVLNELKLCIEWIKCIEWIREIDWIRNEI